MEPLKKIKLRNENSILHRGKKTCARFIFRDKLEEVVLRAAGTRVSVDSALERLTPARVFPLAAGCSILGQAAEGSWLRMLPAGEAAQSGNNEEGGGLPPRG